MRQADAGSYAAIPPTFSFPARFAMGLVRDDFRTCTSREAVRLNILEDVKIGRAHV